MIATRADFVIVPIFLLDRSLDGFGIADRTYDFGLAAFAHDDLLAALGENTAHAFLVENAGISGASFKVSLVPANHPVRKFFAAVLDAGVAADDFEFQAEFEVIDLAVAPDQESVVL